MCTGFEIAALAATGIGTALQMKAQKDVQSDMKKTLRRNEENNRKLEDKNAAALVGARDKYGRETFDEDMDAETAALVQKFQSAQSDGTVPGEFGYGARETPQIIKDFELQKRGDAKAFSNDYAAKLANMAGFGEAMFDNAIGNSRAGEVMDMNRSFMRGNNMATEQRLAAIQAGAGSPLGDLLVAGGSIMGAKALSAPAAGTINWAPNGMTVAQATSKGIPLVPDPSKFAGLGLIGGR
jgi:hypothetical protein